MLFSFGTQAIERLMTPTKVRDVVIQAAIDVRQRAYAEYSNFLVGAAVLAGDEKIYTGCNVENSSYGLTICAERVAVFKAISEGVRKFRRVAVAADTDQLTPPCGACRQILWEFCGDIEITMVNPRNKMETYRLKDLFPRPFDVSYL